MSVVQVSDMTLHVIPKGNLIEITFTGPADTWFAVANNEQTPTMNGSVAFVYSMNETKPQVCFGFGIRVVPRCAVSRCAVSRCAVSRCAVSLCFAERG
jgi:hypothetical protein